MHLFSVYMACAGVSLKVISFFHPFPQLNFMDGLGRANRKNQCKKQYETFPFHCRNDRKKHGYAFLKHQLPPMSHQWTLTFHP